jgi:rubrerythrin
MGAFNPKEIFEIAEQIERNGQAFYRSAAKHISDKGVKELLTELADMEVWHEEYFGTLKNQFKLDDIVDQTNDEYDLTINYLQALVDGEIFNDIKNPLAGINEKSSIEDVLKAAFSFEKNTVAYFAGVKGLIASDEGKKQVEEIIKEEVGHVGMLYQRMKTLGII